MDSIYVAGLSAATAVPVWSRTTHSIQSPTCHPPSMLDFVMDGQKKSVCSEAYLSYAGIWKDCTGGKVSIPGDEVLRVLSLSSMSDVSAYILDSASKVNFANPDNDYAHAECGTIVSWRMFIVLLGLAHQLSDLDLDTFVRQFKFPPAQLLSVRESVTSAAGKQLAYQHSSPPQTSPSGVNPDTPVHSYVNKITPLVSLKPEEFASCEPLSSEQESRDSIADGFQEYSTHFDTTQQNFPLSSDSAQVKERHNALPVPSKDSDKIPNSVIVSNPRMPSLGNIPPMESKGQTSFHDEKYLVEPGPHLSHNIVSFYDGLIPVDYSPPEIDTSPELVSEYSGLQLAQPSLTPESAPVPLESSLQPLGDSRLHIDPPPSDPRISPILVESSQHSELEIVRAIVDPKSELIPVHSLHEETSGLMLDDDWQSVRASTFSGHDGLKPSSTIFEAEVPDVTAESRRIARNRLIALQDKEPSPKPLDGRSLSIFGRKKASEAPKYSLSILTTALEHAVKEGSLPLVATFMEFGADPNYRSKKPEIRHNALQYAATGGFTYIVEYLVHKGADSTSINDALIYAILRGHVNLAMRLISPHGADVNTFKYLPVKQGGVLKFSVGRVYANALAVAAFINNKHDRVRLVQFLLAQGCQIDSIIWFLFRTAENIEHGFGYSNLALFIPKCPDAIKILLNAGIAAHTVRKNADTEVLKGFRKSGFSCDNLSIVQAISRLQSTSWESRTSECLEIAAQLVHNGADLDRLEFDGIEDHTSESGWKMTPLARVIKSGVIKGVKGLIELGANPDSVITFNGQGYTKSRTLLHYAVQQGNIAIIQALISAGVNVNKLSNIYDPQTCQKGETAMAEAASLGYLEIVRELLNAKADPNDGSLHKAARNVHHEIVKLLIQHRARFDIKVDSVSWPNFPETDRLWADNPDCNRVRRPRGDVLCFAMLWPGGRRNTSQEAKNNYLDLVNFLLHSYELQHLRVEQTVLRAALDANNIIGLRQLLNYQSKYKHPGTDLSSLIFYISSQSQHGSMPRLPHSSSKVAYGFTPLQYALMLYCDNSIIELLVSKGASKTRLIYSSDEMDTLVAKGTSLVWEICRANGSVPKRVDGLEGAKEYVTHYRYGGEWRPVHITKIKSSWSVNA